MNETTITIEPGGLVLRGCAVPWNEETVVVSPSPRGGRIVHRELFDDRSIVGVGGLFGKPILIGHDDTRPVGRIRLSRSTGRGLEIEADLVGGDEEIEGIRRRLAAGLQAGLSIGFFPDRGVRRMAAAGDAWRLPLVVRRGVEIREASLVVWPAYAGSLVSGVHVRTVDGERRHVESVEAIAAAQKASAEASAWLAARRGSR